MPYEWITEYTFYSLEGLYRCSVPKTRIWYHLQSHGYDQNWKMGKGEENPDLLWDLDRLWSEVPTARNETLFALRTGFGEDGSQAGIPSRHFNSADQILTRRDGM
jgi:hypothetical protein